MLNVVHPGDAKQTGGWPLALALDDEQLETAANNGLYQISSAAQTLHAPAHAEFRWSDRHLEGTQRIHFRHTYVVKGETSGPFDGAPITAGITRVGGCSEL